MIKRYKQFINESNRIDDLESICKDLETEFKEADIDRNINEESKDVKYISLDFCPIEPEVGSYVSRTEVDIRLCDINGFILVNLSIVSGQYGSDEEENDDFEPEMDYDISSTTLREENNFETKEEALEYLIEKINEFII